jgi:hypothetical protein
MIINDLHAIVVFDYLSLKIVVTFAVIKLMIF